MSALEHVIAVRNRKTLYRDGDRCIKVFNEDFSKADILNEALNQARVENIGINVPKVLEVTMFDGKWAIVSEFIAGRTLEEIRTEAKDESWLKLFVELQCSILNKKNPLLNDLTVKMDRKIDQAKLDGTVRYELHTRLHGMPHHSRVCHGDFNPSNIIIADDGTPYVLDWSHVTQGNASADAARTYLLFRLNKEDGVAERYLDMFCKMRDTEKRYVQSWMPIVAASQSVKGNPEERDFLLSWASVVEYD